MTTDAEAPEPFRAIELPDGSDPISKGIVQRVRRNDGIVTVDVVVEGLGDGLKDRVVQQIRGAALALPETEHVRIQPITRSDDGVEIQETDHVIAVASTKGGVGKTTVSVGLARQLADRGYRVGLFDADIYGPNVPHLFDDLEGPVLTNDVGQPVPLETGNIQMLSPGVVAGDAPTARRGAIAYGAVENLLGQGAWTDRDVMIIDMPAGSDDVTGALLEHVPVDGAVFVTTPFDASIDDTRRTLQLFEENGITPIATAVNMSRFECECCGCENELFEGDVEMDVPVTHELPFDRDLQDALGSRDRHGAFDDLSASVERFVEDVLEAIPDGAIDLRGLPFESQIRQLSAEIAIIDRGETVSCVVENPTQVIEAIESDTEPFLGSIERSQVGTTGALLELTRR